MQDWKVLYPVAVTLSPTGSSMLCLAVAGTYVLSCDNNNDNITIQSQREE